MWANVKSGNNVIESRQLEPGELLLGRDADCDLVVDDQRVSRHHAKLWVNPDGTLEVEDNGSTNGTYVNGVRISGRTFVRNGDEIRLGRHFLQISTTPARLGQQTVVGDEAPQPYAPPQPAAPNPYAAAQPAAPNPDAPAQPTPPYAPGWPAAQSPYSPAQTPAPPAGGLFTPPPPPGAPAQAFTAPASPAFGAYAATPRRKGRKLAIGIAIVAIAAIGAAVGIIIPKLGGPNDLSAAQLSQHWGPSTLYIQANIKGKPIGSGTAWIYNAKQGLLVTNAHVVNAGNQYQIGRGASRQTAHLVGVSVCDDLAVLKVPTLHGLPQFNLGSQAQVQQGETTIALGYPGNAAKSPNLSETTGVVSVTRTQFAIKGLDTPHYPDVIQTTAPINPGNSGGPLLDDHGHLIGINTATVDATPNGESIQNEGYAIGVDRAKTVIAKLAKGDSVGFTGMKFLFPEQNSDFTQFGLPVVNGGLIVYAADPGSPAAKQGFGSEPVVVTAINGHSLDGTLSSYCNIVGKMQTGQTATFRVATPDNEKLKVRVPFE